MYYKTIKNRFLVFLLIWLGMTSFISAQTMHEIEEYPILLKGLEGIIKKGNKRSLRDLGSLLNKKELNEPIREILKKHTLFTKDEIDISTVSHADFLSFFYEQQTRIRFSGLFGAFYITPLEERKHTYQVNIPSEVAKTDKTLHTQAIVNNYIHAYQQKDITRVIEQIHLLEKIGSITSSKFLESQLLNKEARQYFSKADEVAWYIALINANANTPTYRAVKCILSLIEQGTIPFESVQYSLSRFTNISIPPNSKAVDFAKEFQHLSDSLFTLSAIRAHGYDQQLGFRSNFFFEDVDYYGKIYCQKNKHPWLSKNAFQDMLTTQHPRMLLYLASYIYQYRLQVDKAEYQLAIAMMEQFTKIPIQLTNRQSYEDFLIYWWQSYDTYEWNSENSFFVNKEERIKREAEYEKLFRRLNSKNDEAALAAYLTLLDGRPKEVIQLLQNYRPLLRTINSKLPNIKLAYMEQLVQLNFFCKENQINLVPKASLATTIKQLETTQDPKAIYKLETDIIATMQLDDLTPIEYWAIINTKNRAANMSISRIIDLYYSIHWETIQQSDQQLRLFLKKAQLYKAIGASGICNSYLNKININDPLVQERLKSLLQVETDEGIKAQIAQVLVKEVQSNTTNQTKVANFIKAPLSLNRIELQILPSPSLSEVKAICKAIKLSKDTEIIKQYFTYLSYHPSMEAVPVLFELIDEQTILIKNQDKPLTVGQRVVPILEDIYDYSFDTKETTLLDASEWKRLWKTDKKNYAKWGDLFLAKKIKTLQMKEELSIDELNEFIELAEHSPQFTKASLELLPKVSPIKNIRRLDLIQKLDLTHDLHYFKGLGFNHKQLDDVAKHFEIAPENQEQAALMLDYFEEEANAFDALDKASFYNALFNQKWFLSHVLTGNIAAQRIENYTASLEFYLDESDYLSEYEEQRILQNLTNLSSIGKPLSVKLESALSLDADDKLKANIQQDIIAHIAYSEIGIVADYIPYLNRVPGQNTYDFLSKDFGLPIFHMDSTTMTQLIENHKQLSEAEFHMHYLKKFGVDFLTNNQLDFEKIYRILQFDIVSPLTGAGGSKRDYFVYGIIKLLEIHFDTRLGFHEKLNESQTFYTFTSNKRAKAWLAYLEEKQLVSNALKLPPSFNTTRVLESANR